MDERRSSWKPQEIQWWKRESTKWKRLLRVSSRSELGQIAHGSFGQDLWLGDEKVGFQVVGVDQGCPNFFYHGPHSEEYTKVRASH